MENSKDHKAAAEPPLDCRVMPTPCAKFHFYRDWACYAWTVSVGKYHSRFLPMRGGSVWERQDGYRACWRWIGGA